MPVIQVGDIEANLSGDQLLQAVRQLRDAELAEFSNQVLRLQSERRSPHLSAAETALFTRINRAPPEAERREYAQLREKLAAEALTEVEHARLCELSDRREELNAERVEAMTLLAALRGTTLRELMAQLGITGQVNG